MRAGGLCGGNQCEGQLVVRQAGMGCAGSWGCARGLSGAAHL